MKVDFKWTRDEAEKAKGHWGKTARTYFEKSPRMTTFTLLRRGGPNTPYHPHACEFVHVASTGGKWGKGASIRVGSIVAEDLQAHRERYDAEQELARRWQRAEVEWGSAVILACVVEHPELSNALVGEGPVALVTLDRLKELLDPEYWAVQVAASFYREEMSKVYRDFWTAEAVEAPL